MKRQQPLDFKKLLGFDAVVEHVGGSVDFKNETVSARLGAKVGEQDGGPAVLSDQLPNLESADTKD
jgi:hypothetical protein